MIYFMQGVSDKLVKMDRQRVDNRIEVIAKAHRRSVHGAKNEKNVCSYCTKTWPHMPSTSHAIFLCSWDLEIWIV